MTKYATGNPVGSSDPRDLYDTATVADNLVHGDEAAYTDRLGKSRKSWQGMEDEFAAFIASSGYEFVGDYAAGIELTGYQQILRDTSGEFWRLSGSVTLPYTTTGAGLPEGGNFVAVGDAALRQELALPVSGGNGSTLVNGATIYVGSVAELEGLSLAEGVTVYLTQEGMAGSGVIKSGAHSADPQKGIFIDLANGNYWQRRFDGISPSAGIMASWFGLKESTPDAQTPVQAAIDYSTSIGFIPVKTGAGTFTFTAGINLSGSNPTVNPNPVPFVPLWGEGRYNTILDFSGNTGESHILVERGSGSINLSKFGRFTIRGRSGTGVDPDHGIEIAGKGGVIPYQIYFEDMNFACQFHNRASGEFTELCVLTECSIGRTCEGTLRYRITSGNESFHGSGMRLCEINTDGIRPVVTVNDGALVYNAPIDARVWTYVDSVLIQNDNTSPRRAVYSYGDIKHESFSSTTLKLCNSPNFDGGTYHEGFYHAFGGNIDEGDFYLCDTVRLNSDGSITAMYKPKSFTQDLTTGSNTLSTLVARNFDCGTEWSVSIRASNYEFYYVVHTMRGSSAGTAFNVVSTLESNNTAGYGAPTFSVDSQGQLIITNASFPATGVTAYVTARPLGQRIQSHP